MAATGMALQGLWPDVEWGDLSLQLPTVTFAQSMTLPVGERLIELHYVGPAHSTNDTVVWVPDAKVLFAGDVVLPGCTPFCLMGSIQGSLEALARLRAFGAETVIGGHGQVTGPEVFDETERYLRRIVHLAKVGIAEGATPLQIAHGHGAGQFSELIDPERLVGNLHRAYLELERPELPLGAELNVPEVFNEMVEFNGGRLPTCLA
jgi:cyclase